MSDVAPSVTRTDLLGTPLRPEEVAQLISAIVGGGQFSSTLTRLSTSGASLIFPVVSEIDEPQWVEEFGLFPTLGMTGEPVVVMPATLGGIVLIPGQLVDDLSRNLTAEVQTILRSRFSAKLDADLLAGTGAPAPTPTGILDSAAEVTAPSLWAGAIRAKAEISAAGGSASHVVATAEAIAAEEERVDADGRPLYPDGLATFAGLQVVPSPAASQPLVYDSSRTYLVTRQDFSALLSDQYSPAYERRALALRLDGRFALGVPSPAQSVRKLTIGGGGANGGTRASASRSA